MNIRPDKYKKLIAINNSGDIINISNMIMRKQRWEQDQDKDLSPNSLCIVCNFSYYYKDRGWSKNIKAICHPFKDYKQPFKDKELHLFSESDFCDNLWMEDISLLKEKDSYEYDFFCYTLDSKQGARCKGFYSLPLIFEAAKELGMRGFVLDYSHKKYSCNKDDGWGIQVKKIRLFLDKCKNVTIKRGVLDQSQINDLVDRCQFVMFPNTNDASPRTIPETLLRGKPIMVNNNILGGWKYVSDNNGILYDGSSDTEQLTNNKEYYYNIIKKSLIEMKNKKINAENIKNEYLNKYGFINSSKRLAQIINDIEGHNKYKYVAYAEFHKYFKKINKEK